MSDDLRERVARARRNLDHGEEFTAADLRAILDDHARLTAAIAALEALDKPRVSPLVWSEWDENSNYPSCDALGAFSLWYFIDTSEARHGEPDFPLFKKTCDHTPRKRLSEHHSVEDAKAAAQADYEARILEAIEPTPVSVREAARVLLDDRWRGYESKRAREAMWNHVHDVHGRYMLPMSAYSGVLIAALHAIAEGKDDD